jgi:proteic killer suppression protein
VIKPFQHKGLRRFFETSNAAGIQAAHAKRLRMQLAALDTAHSIGDMDIPGFRLHPLKGALLGRWSITVNGTTTDIRIFGRRRSRSRRLKPS